jgi:hypothetical protein
MIHQKLISSLATLALIAGGSSRALSQEIDLNFTIPSTSGGHPALLAQTFQTPPGTPPGGGGGGVRGSGIQSINIIPLTPKDEATNTFWGQTLNATPTFFLYLPTGIEQTIKFYLVDEVEGETIYETFLAPPSGGGIISVAMPKEGGKTLKEGRIYSWYFEIHVNLTESNLNPSVSGLVQRIAPSPELMTRLQAAVTDDDRSKIYAANGLWYDLIATAATLRSTNPTNWEAMLNSVGLEAIAQAPLITPATTITNSNRNLPENRPTPN